MPGWYQEGSIIDAIRGGDVKTGKDFIDKPLNSFIDNWRRDAQKKDALSGIDWSTREFDDNGRVKVTKSDYLLGRSQSELQAAWEKDRQTQIRDTLGDKYYETFGSDLTVDYKTDPSKLSTKINKETKRAEDVKPYLTALTTTRGGSEVLAGLGDRPSVEQVQQALSGLTTRNTETSEGKVQAETQRLETRLDKQRASDEARYDAQRKSDEDWRRYQSEENNRLERKSEAAENRELTREQNMVCKCSLQMLDRCG